MEKTIINSGPSQKFGIARPNKEKTSAKRSAAALRRGEDAERKGDQQRDRHRGQRKLKRRRDARGDETGDRSLVVERAAEIALRQAGEELDVLGEQGLVEPQLARERGFVGARCQIGREARRERGEIS